MELDPTDVARLQQVVLAWAAPGEQLCPVPIDQIVLSDDALSLLPRLVRELSSGPAVLVVDQTPMTRLGGDVKDQVARSLSAVMPLTVRVLPEPFHADLPSARALAAELDGVGVIVSLGSGGVTDVAKYARHLTGRRLPFVSVPTAASVTAFTSALSVLLVDGAKRTLPSAPPEVVVCDLPTLCEAPVAMTCAGFGDVLARSVSYGDWYLAAELGMADGFSHVPGRMLAACEQIMLGLAEGVATRQPAAVKAVMEAVLLSGMAMSVVGQTSPLSGWEHVISHFLDMTAHHDGRRPALHGEQVGVATLLAARAYEQAWPQLDLDALSAELTDDRVAVGEARVKAVFDRYDASGALSAEVWRDYRKKLTRWQAVRGQRQEFAARKRSGELDAVVADMVRPSADIETALRRAGAPLAFDQMTQPVPAATAEAAVRHSHLIRERFTLGDLLDGEQYA